jgi:histidine triad (HIT) family protein
MAEMDDARERCVFCKIVRGEVPSRIVYSDDSVVAFPDINPRAPVHLLVIPREHIPDLQSTGEDDEGLLGHLFGVAKTLAQREGIAETGYRLAMNLGRDGGQQVAHLHLHVMGGRRLGSMG